MPGLHGISTRLRSETSTNFRLQPVVGGDFALTPRLK